MMAEPFRLHSPSLTVASQCDDAKSVTCRVPELGEGQDSACDDPFPPVVTFLGCARAQIDIDNGKLVVVQTLTEAFDRLRLRKPDFKPIVIADLH